MRLETTPPPPQFLTITFILGCYGCVLRLVFCLFDFKCLISLLACEQPLSQNCEIHFPPWDKYSEVHRGLNSLVVADLFHLELLKHTWNRRWRFLFDNISSTLQCSWSSNFCQSDGYILFNFCFYLQLLIATYAVNFSTNLIAITASPFGNCLFISFAHFLIGFLFLVNSEYNFYRSQHTL